MPSQFSGCCFRDLGSWQGSIALYPLLVELQFGSNSFADALASNIKGLLPLLTTGSAPLK